MTFKTHWETALEQRGFIIESIPPDSLLSAEWTVTNIETQKDESLRFDHGVNKDMAIYHFLTIHPEVR